MSCAHVLRVCSSQCIAASIVLDPLHNHCINTHVHKKARTSTHTHMHIVHMKRYFERWRDYFTPVFVELKHLSKHTTLTSSIHVCRATSLLAPHPAPLVVTARSKSTSIVLRLTWLGGYVHGSAFKNLLLLSNTYTHMHIIYPCTRKVIFAEYFLHLQRKPFFDYQSVCDVAERPAPEPAATFF